MQRLCAGFSLCSSCFAQALTYNPHFWWYYGNHFHLSHAIDRRNPPVSVGSVTYYASVCVIHPTPTYNFLIHCCEQLLPGTPSLKWVCVSCVSNPPPLWCNCWLFPVGVPPSSLFLSLCLPPSLPLFSSSSGWTQPACGRGGQLSCSCRKGRHG